MSHVLTPHLGPPPLTPSLSSLKSKLVFKCFRSAVFFPTRECLHQLLHLLESPVSMHYFSFCRSRKIITFLQSAFLPPPQYSLPRTPTPLSPSPIRQHRYAPHSMTLGLLKVLSTWLMGRHWATAMTGSQTVQLTGTSCGCTWTVAFKCPSSFSMFLVWVPRSCFPPSRRPRGSGQTGQC